MLRVSKVPPGDPTTEDYVGQNRFECLTCPYHFVINKRYFERKYMKKKEVEDILGGKGAWDNVDKTQGKFRRAFRNRHAESDFGVVMMAHVY
jgi:DNA-directed RNA polymerase III subunit RPC11